MIVGASAAGVAAVETARRLDPACQITLISDEPVPLYSRCLLSDYLVGQIDRTRLAFRPADWPAELDVEVLHDHVAELDAGAGVVRTAQGRRVPFDGLLIATGARPVLPAIQGIQTGGVYAPYRLDQVEAALTAMRQARHVVVLGAGKVGVKCAEAAAKRGHQVALVEQASHLMPGVLDEPAAAMVNELLERNGVQIRVGTTVEEVRSKDGTVSEVLLKGGESLPCQVLLVAVGVQCNVELALHAGAQVRQGVVVGCDMQTSLAGIYAAGDVTEGAVLHCPDQGVLANWINAVQQGRVAAYNLVGEERQYPGRIRASSLRLWDLPIVSLGQVETNGVVQSEYACSAYRKLVFREGRVVGVLQVGGDIADVGVLSALMKRGAPISNGSELVTSGFAHFRAHRSRWKLARVRKG